MITRSHPCGLAAARRWLDNGQFLSFWAKVGLRVTMLSVDGDDGRKKLTDKKIVGGWVEII